MATLLFSLLSLSFPTPSLSLSLSLSLSHTHTHTHTYPRLTEIIMKFGNIFGSHRSENFHLANRLSNQHGVLVFISNCPSAVLDRLTDALLYHDAYCSRWPPAGYSSCKINLLKLHRNVSLALAPIAIQSSLFFCSFCVIFTGVHFDHKRP